MKKIIYVFLVFALAVSNIAAQTTILDFESPATNTSFQFFESSIDGTITEAVANPDPSGLNTSAMVAKHDKPAGSQPWAGAFTNPDPATPVDFATNGKVTMNVWMDHIGTVTLKLEGSPNGGTNWEVSKPNTKVNEWEEITFNATDVSNVAPFNTAVGFTYARVVIFMDLGTIYTEDMSFYFDDVVAHPATAAPTVTILDWETPETSTDFQYFASGLEGMLTNSIANPDPSGINTSANVLEFIDGVDGNLWAGAFSMPNPTIPVDVSNGGQICMKVWMDHIGNFALKLEGGTDGQPNWVQQVSNTKINEWEELCFDVNLPSLEAPEQAASGIYTTIVLFSDFFVPGGGMNVTSYVDDIVVKSGTGPQIRKVHFAVDMNNYVDDFDQVYVSGSFNNWDGVANPLSDPEFDGIWEGEITVPTGVYEYKVTLDDWAVQEEFRGVEECTITDPSGQFVNRRISVTGDVDVPLHCFNSCYACGEEKMITFRLGMGMVTPNADGVWLSGGGNFGNPGGAYKMNDLGGGIYELAVPRKTGFESYYAFANGPCPDYSCKEDLTGTTCGDPNNFNDRWLPALAGDVTIETCFGLCSDNVQCVSGTNAAIRDAGLFQILGNPSVDGQAVFQFAELSKEKAMTITNTLGQVVHTVQIGASTSQFNLNTAKLATGLYYVNVRTEGSYLTEILVVK